MSAWCIFPLRRAPFVTERHKLFNDVLFRFQQFQHAAIFTQHMSTNCSRKAVLETESQEWYAGAIVWGPYWNGSGKKKRSTATTLNLDPYYFFHV